MYVLRPHNAATERPAMLMGIDIGTSGTKGVVVSDDGHLRAASTASYDFARPAPGWTEQAPNDWWIAARSVIRALLAHAHIAPRDIRGIGLSGQMHGAVLLDTDALVGARDREIHAARPALLWNDQRTAPFLQEIETAAGGKARLIRMSGNAALAGFTLPKLFWIRHHEPELFNRIRCVMNPKDFIRLQLTGIAATDVGDASGTLLFDVDRRTWCPDLIRNMNIDPALLPDALESAAPAGGITPWAAHETGLIADTIVVAGSGDNMCGAIGAGVVDPGVVLATLGTSGVIYAHAEHLRRDLPEDAAIIEPSRIGRIHTMCAADGTARSAGAWCTTGCMLSAGGSLRWARDTLAPAMTFSEVTALAETIAPGAEGLLFLPHLTGERCPYPDPAARGAWIGLTARHTTSHMFRAVLEGVANTLAGILEIVRALPVDVQRVRIGGGGGESPLWRQILADSFRLPIDVMRASEGPAFGAALLAGVGTDLYPSIAEACRATLSVQGTHEPGSASGLYAHHRAYLEAAYVALQPLNESMQAEVRNR
jgi:xylulokinase